MTTNEWSKAHGCSFWLCERPGRVGRKIGEGVVVILWCWLWIYSLNRLYSSHLLWAYEVSGSWRQKRTMAVKLWPAVNWIRQGCLLDKSGLGSVSFLFLTSRTDLWKLSEYGEWKVQGATALLLDCEFLGRACPQGGVLILP